jgi:DNA-binding CsgD family transcriptional regulator
MVESLLFIFSFLTFGIQLGSFFLGLYFYLSHRELWKLKGILFLGYLVLLYFLTIIRFYLSQVLGLEHSLLFMIIYSVEMTGISLLVYYFSATINYFMQRKWRKSKLLWVLIAVLATFVLSVLLVIHNYSPLIKMILSILLVLSMIIISMDALRSLPLIQRETDRSSITMLLGLTLLFIPLLLTSRFLQIYLENPQISSFWTFFVTSCYYLGMGIILIRFFIKRSLEHEERVLKLSEQPWEFYENLSITPREKDIVLLLEQGLSYKEIGSELSISINTVNNHIANIYKKFSVRSKVELLNALRDKQ